MDDWLVLTITGASIVLVVVLIIFARLNPAVSLVIGAGVMGLSLGLGAEDTAGTILGGFGEIMAEVGLLIAWGVLMGSILNKTGAIPRLVDRLLGLLGPRFVPYGLALTLGTALQSIFLDVLLVMTAPLAKRIAPRLGRNGVARISTAMAIGLECGIVLMVPGVATLALAGILGVPLGQMLLYGLIVIVPTIIVSIFIMDFAFSRGFWNPGKDQQPIDPEDLAAAEAAAAEAKKPQRRSGSKVGLLPRRRVSVETQSVETVHERASQTNLFIFFIPMLVSLLLIGSGAVIEATGAQLGDVVILTQPVVALLLGLLGTSVIARVTIGGKETEGAVVAGFKESGQILILTGAGGSLAAVVASTGMGDILSGAFSATTFAPILVVWGIAAVLHIAVGSVSISAITAAGILAPVAATLGIDPVLIALAAGAGSLFAVHVTSNTFWLLQSMLGQTTRGTFKTCTVGVSVASVVGLGFTLVLSLFL